MLLTAALLMPSGAEARDGRLFTLLDTPSTRAAAERSSIASIRESAIRIDGDLLRGSESITLDLFDSRSFTARRIAAEGLEIRSARDLTWRGKITDGSFSGDVVITQKSESFSGIIYSPYAVYEIVPRGDKHYLVELDQTLFPPCGGEVKGDVGVEQRTAGAEVDSGDRIDVLVLYTAAVRTSAGGDTQAQTIAQQAVDATNTAYINSKIRQRVRLVRAEFTAMVETGSFNTELSNLRADTAANMRRDELRADLVAMLTNSTAACGIGYLMGPPGGNPNNGFTVTARTCAVGNLTLAHELGHNMGSHHNPENGGTATYPYSFGHYLNGSFRTVMSYTDPCTAGCPRAPHFSNPDVIYNSAPTGVENARDNARSLNNTADWIANYRYSGQSITLGNYNGNEIVPRNIHLSMIWTSNNVSGDVRIELSHDGGTTWRTLFNRTPNDNQEYFSFGPRVTKQARLRITSHDNPNVGDTSSANISIR
ncbi:MAG: hypothetical protein IPM59_11540 [Chloracidobacterium sp.]|nr:hypothetical protein [Chloracidobacterium sp.]